MASLISYQNSTCTWHRQLIHSTREMAISLILPSRSMWHWPFDHVDSNWVCAYLAKVLCTGLDLPSGCDWSLSGLASVILSVYMTYTYSYMAAVQYCNIAWYIHSGIVKLLNRLTIRRFTWTKCERCIYICWDSGRFSSISTGFYYNQKKRKKVRFIYCMTKE